MPTVYPLRSARLLLRPFAASDLEGLYAYLRRPEVCRYLYESPLRSLDEAHQALALRRQRCAIRGEGESLNLAVLLSEDGPLIGDVLLHYTSREHRQGELGFVFNPAHHGHGYATEAARLLLTVGFEELRLHRIVARCDDRNLPSARVMERLGMAREAHLIENEYVKGEWTSELVYALRRSQWLEHRQPVPAPTPAGVLG